MAFSVSPSVNFVETDFSQVVRSQTNAIGAMAGKFAWGPVEDPFLITTGSSEFVERFGKPSNDNFLSTMMGIDFLSYVDQLWVCRVAGPNVRNSVRSGQTPVYVLNDDAYDEAVISGTEYIGKYPGALGNNLIVDIADAAKFEDWVYADYFSRIPQPGEYSMVVLDRDGYFSGGLGASGQIDYLTVAGTATGGTKQVEDFEFTGTAVDGGVKQVETLSINGVATDVGPLLIAHTGETPGNVSVDVVVGDLPSDVAAKVAVAFAADANFYSATVVNGSQVQVVYADYALHTKIADYTLSGISITSTITTAGTDEIDFLFDGNTVTVADGDTPAEVATKVKAVLDTVSTYYSVVDDAAGTLTITFATPALRTAIADILVGTVAGSSTITTPGDAYFDYSYLSQTIQLKYGDNSATCATKIAQGILAGLSTTYSVVETTGSIIKLTFSALGVQTVTDPKVETDGIAITTAINTASNYGDILEKYECMTAVVGDKYDDGSIRYYVEKINTESDYIRVGDTSIALAADTIELAGGVDDNSEALDAGFELLENSETYDFVFLFGALTVAEQQKMIDVAETRRDCKAHISPMLADVRSSDFVTDVTEWSSLELARDSSYVVKTGNWAYIKDTYNETWRWIPVCAGTAGIEARMYTIGQPWYSPADPDYGYYLNYNKLACNPTKAQRDRFVKYQINPVVAFKGDGIRLYGDWTGTIVQSAFQFLNVRNLFIELEKAIVTYAHQYLFKINDEITQAQFLNSVRPFLRDVQSKRGMEDFRVICDARNNTPQRTMNGEFYADFLIKPLYSIRYIYLNFAAVRSDFSFDEIEKAIIG